MESLMLYKFIPQRGGNKPSTLESKVKILREWFQARKLRKWILSQGNTFLELKPPKCQKQTEWIQICPIIHH